MSEWTIVSRGGESKLTHHHANPGWIARKLNSFGPNAVIECICGVELKWILASYPDGKSKWVVIG